MGIADIFGNMLVLLTLTISIKNLIFTLINKSKLTAVKTKNTRLNELRDMPYKSLEEQREFINLKFPIRPPFVWKWKMVGAFMKQMFYFAIVGMSIRYVILQFGWNFSIGEAILFVTAYSIILEVIMRQFNIESTDFTYVLGLRKRKVKK